MFTASAFEGYATLIDEVQGQRTRIEVSGRKYAEAAGMWPHRTRAGTEVEEASMTVDTILSSCSWMTMSTASRSVVPLATLGEVTHGSIPDEDSAGLASDYKWTSRCRSPVESSRRPSCRTLFYMSTWRTSSESMVSQGAFDMVDRASSNAAATMCFTITSLDSMFQALGCFRARCPDLVVKVTARFTSVYQCTGGSDFVGDRPRRPRHCLAVDLQRERGLCYRCGQVPGRRRRAACSAQSGDGTLLSTHAVIDAATRAWSPHAWCTSSRRWWRETSSGTVRWENDQKAPRGQPPTDAAHQCQRCPAT